MPFATDQQTIDDLNIFGRQGADSIYSLFNRTCTRGGAAFLEECFRYPLADADAINHRSAIIRHFSDTGTTFPFRPDAFDQAEQYLANTDERTRLTTTDRSISGRMAGLIAGDTESRTIQKGVHALLDILQTLRHFMPVFDQSPFRTEKTALEAGLAEPGLQPVLQALPDHLHATQRSGPAPAGKTSGLSPEKTPRLPFETIAAFDSLLRFRHRGTIQHLLQHIYRLDMYIAVAQLARDRGFAFAAALPKEAHSLRLEGVYHPLVRSAVPNTLEITAESNFIFLTGANMAGKSTFMKALGIAMYLAHMGFPVPAAKMTFAVRDAIYTTINLPDNLGMGASHFYAEVLHIKKIARELSAGKSLFVIFDELFRGTNVKDAYEATVALSTAFSAHRSSTFLVSTHIIEAGEVLRERCPNIQFLYLPTRMQQNQPIYTYTLENGITADRHGMVIITNEAILDILQKGRPKPVKNNRS